MLDEESGNRKKAGRQDSTRLQQLAGSHIDRRSSSSRIHIDSRSSSSRSHIGSRSSSSRIHIDSRSSSSRSHIDSRSSSSRSHIDSRSAVLQDSTVCTEGSGASDASEESESEAGGEDDDVPQENTKEEEEEDEDDHDDDGNDILLSEQPDREAGGDVVPMEVEPPVTAVNYSATNTLPARPGPPSSPSGPGWAGRGSGRLPRSHSLPSLSHIPSAENKSFTRANSSPDVLLESSFEEFTPDISADEEEEAYRFQCCRPGLYQCSVTGLLFHMEAEGDVVYRTVPWSRRLLAQHHKQPAGPLFDITCEQRSVCQLHLPHCEIRSTGGWRFLSVAHEHDDGVEFIGPHKITDTHVVINVTGFSAFGNVKDEDCPPDPVRALVLLFYRPPADPEPESLLNVLMLPRNVVLRDVLRTRRKLVGDEVYIETSPHCKLHPKQEYTLTAGPGDDSVLVQPAEAEFDSDNYDNYFPSFQVSWETVMKHMRLFLRDTSSSSSVWERRVCLSSAGVRRSFGPSALNLPPDERLMEVRSSFIYGISGPVLQSLLDKLFEKTVLAEPERESADEFPKLRDKARFVFDTVRKKGGAASSQMIEFLCEVDPFLCEHLGLLGTSGHEHVDLV
ncbi:NACHT, LRR and PYD domains-containing protein 1b allele 3-like [Pempheris klunzingeri]|uniref:NACHT, LRR and PYD domains-containing protein 1b allele 3-like n=1 Tax=Pempheris klunzingeri TaxID=3127111 RepID=UPI00397EB568